ncbi:MAG: RNA polymerase sigma factor, partial [Acidobacteria bacterium]|nr:RNA polymerase sigma factor [Acidobacteriota bacterium]
WERGPSPGSMKQTDVQGELERLRPASFGWALWCCNHRRDEAEEVLQTAYLKVLEGRASFDGNSSLRTWFFAVIRRTASEQQRRRWLRDQILGRWLTFKPTAVPPPDPEEMASGSESNRALRKALDGLPARQREVLHLVFYQDLTIEEASRILRISLGTARTHFERGKAQLRKILAQEKGKHDGQ